MAMEVIKSDLQMLHSVRDLMDAALKAGENKIAFKYFRGKEVFEATYREFSDTTDYLGTALCTLGINDKHCAILGKNSYDWVTAYITVLKSSGVAVPIDKELPFADIANVLTHSDSEILFYASEYEDDIKANIENLPNIKYFIGFDRTEDEGKLLSFQKLIESGKEALKNGNDAFLHEKSDEDALKLLVYTSGTTGNAKGVMLSLRNILGIVFYGLSIANIRTICLSVLPYNHTYAAVAEILVSLYCGATICINDSLRNVSKNIQRFQPEYIYIVPAFAEVFYKKVISNAEKQGKLKTLRLMIKICNALHLGVGIRRKIFKSVIDGFGGRLEKIVCGGAPVRSEIADFFNSVGVALVNGYGITECSPLVSVNTERDNEPESVGVLIPCVEVKFEDVGDDGCGEICVKGDTIMLGYYKQPELTAEVLSEDGWFRTGDYGRMSKRGHLMITGRKKNLIVLSNGKNIYPEEIENYILSIPYVAETVVTASVDGNGNQSSLCAHVFLNADAVKELGITDAAAALKKDISAATAVLPSYKHITDVIIRDTEFPKTTTKKIKRSLI